MQRKTAKDKGTHQWSSCSEGAIDETLHAEIQALTGAFPFRMENAVLCTVHGNVEELPPPPPDRDLIIELLPGSEARFVDILAKDTKKERGCIFLLREDSSLSTATLEDCSGHPHITQHVVAKAEKGTSLRMRNATLGEVDAHHTVRVIVEGDEAECSLDWIIFAKGKSRLRISTEVSYLGRDGRGETTLYGVAEGEAEVRCDGSIRIGPLGAGTETFLTERFLMLDPTVKIDAVPELKIETSDVKAGHAATMTKVSEEDLFYIRTRGIDALLARRLLVEGFLKASVGKCEDKEIARRIQCAIERQYLSKK